MMTKDQYIESLRKLNLNLYMFGKKVEIPSPLPTSWLRTRSIRI